MKNKDIFMNFWNENFEGLSGESVFLKAYNEYPKASERAAWEALDKEYIATLVAEGEKYLDYTFKAIPASLFNEFSRNGNRVHFEDAYFEKRRTLNALVLAECAEHKGRFMDRIIDGIFSLCEESAWQLPPHNSYERNKPQAPYPDATSPVLDLFACETGALLSVVLYLLKEELDIISPFISKRIMSELRFRIIAPYLNTHFWWMGNGDEDMCNWTPWCYQNCLLTYFMMAEFADPEDSLFDADTRLRFFKKACYGMDCFLKDYGDDGCCNEGTQYFRHAGLCMYGAMKVMDYVSAGKLSVLYANEKIKNMAKYIMNMHIQDIYYVNFADCSPIAGRCTIREYLYGKSISLNALMNMAAGDYQKTEDKLNTTEINLFYRLLSAFTHEEVMNYHTTEYIEKPDMYYESVGIFLARDSKHALAVKTGCNADSHNHNDTGSITVYKEGKPFLIDVGVETYTRKTFSADRYEIWTMQSSYHNLPEINHVMQKDGKEFCATDVKVDFNAFTPNISMNIAKAYPGEAGIGSYIRSVTLCKETFAPSSACETTTQGAKTNLSRILVSDSFDVAPEKVVLSLMTYEEPKLVSSESKKTTLSVGSLGFIEFSSATNPEDVTIEEIPITDARLMTAWKHSVYRILVKTREQKIEFSLI